MPLRIAIDVRRIRDFGIGTYIRNLVQGLAALDRENHYVLVAPSADEPDLADLPPELRDRHLPRHGHRLDGPLRFLFLPARRSGPIWCIAL